MNAHSKQPTCTGGLYETCAGTPDLAASIRHDERFSCRADRIGERPIEQASGSRRNFSFEEDKTHWLVDFDAPRSDHALHQRRSGKLEVVRFASTSRFAARLQHPRPGCPGNSFYTWRVGDVEATWKRVSASGAGKATDMLADEVGAPAISFRARDGCFWTLIQVR